MTLTEYLSFLSCRKGMQWGEVGMQIRKEERGKAMLANVRNKDRTPRFLLVSWAGGEDFWN